MTMTTTAISTMPNSPATTPLAIAAVASSDLVSEVGNYITEFNANQSSTCWNDKDVFTSCLLHTAHLSSEAIHTLTTERVDTIHTHTISTAVPIHAIINVGLTISTSVARFTTDTGEGITIICTLSLVTACDSIGLTMIEDITTASNVEWST